MEKLLNTRIALRIDTLENWLKTDADGKGAKLVLKHGEIGLCEIPSGDKTATTAPTVLFKVGDGKTAFGSLNWASALAADVYSWAKAETVVLTGETIQFKTGDTVVHSIDLSKFALNTELTNAITSLTAADTALGKRIDDVIASAYDDTAVRKLISDEVTARTNADTALDGKITTAQNAANTAQSEVDALEKTVATLSNTVASGDATNKSLVQQEAAARESADEAIENKIGEVTTGKTVVEMISDAQTAAEAKVTALSNGQVKTNKEDIATIKGDYLKNSDKVSIESKITANTTKITTDISNAKTELKGTTADTSNTVTIYGAKKYAEEKAAAVQTNLDNHVSAYNTKVKALEDADSALDGKIAKEIQDRTAAVSGVTTAVATEKSRAEGVEADLQTQINAINTNIASGLHFRGVVSKTADITDPKSGDICIVGNQEFIYDGTGWEELGNAEAHATVTYVDTELGKKVNSTTYSAKVAELVQEDADIRADFADADATMKSELEGKINAKAAQSDFNTLKGRVDTLSTSKLDASVYNEHITAYNAHITAQSSADSAQNSKIQAIETSLAEGGTINDLIKAAQTQANKGVADAKAAQDDVDALEAKIGTISGKTLVEQIAAIKSTADAAAKATEVAASLADINTELAKKATTTALNGVADRVTTAEGKITTAEGNISTLQTKVSNLEKTYTNAQVDTAISNAVAAEKTRAEAAESALDQRIDAYDERFGTKDDILVFNCGSASTVI
jgi:hypothetical protein